MVKNYVEYLELLEGAYELSKVLSSTWVSRSGSKILSRSVEVFGFLSVDLMSSAIHLSFVIVGHG